RATLLPSGGRDRLTPARTKVLLRGLIRRVILQRPAPETVAITIVWVSGARSCLSAQPSLHRGQDLPTYDRLVARVLALSAEGYHDPEIARRLTLEGYRSARRLDVAPTEPAVV